MPLWYMLFGDFKMRQEQGHCGFGNEVVPMLSQAPRLHLSKGKTEEDLTEALASLPAGLAHSRNLHAADVYPVE